MPMPLDAESSPPPIDRGKLAHKLDDFTTWSRTSAAFEKNRQRLLDSQIAVAIDLQDLVGPGVVIFYKGRAFVPVMSGSFPAYKILPVYDLDAALIGQAIEARQSHGFNPPSTDEESQDVR